MKSAVASVTIFILISLGIIFFLFNQNQNLKRELASYLPTFTPTPQQTSQPSPTPELPIIISPLRDSKIKSPLTISGTVPAGWMFEGVFPIKLIDLNEKVVAETQGKEVITGSWQNGNPVEFTATLMFKTSSGSGTLVLENDNPSGELANLKTFKIPVNF